MTSIETPAFVISLRDCKEKAESLASALLNASVTTLFAAKACNIGAALDAIGQCVKGFSVSSLYEARLAREIGLSNAIVHYVSPLLNSSHLDGIVHYCNRVTLNSRSQLSRYEAQLAGAVELGIRVNPGLSFANDARYDPCRRNSKLGVPLDDLAESLRTHPKRFASVSGIHVHTNCDSQDLRELLATIRQVESVIGSDLGHFQWFNVGGGYAFTDECGIDEVVTEFRRISDQYGLEIVIEPGSAIVRSAGRFVATVEDIVEGDDYPIAILDTTVNHWPEVFEYQFEPDVEGHVDDGRFTYLLAGCSCLAGDLFGEYSFNEPLKVGSRVVFRNAGAYSIVKANMFKGINLPNIYSLTEEGDLILVKRFTYEEFSSRCGVDTGAIVGT